MIYLLSKMVNCDLTYTFVYQKSAVGYHKGTFGKSAPLGGSRTVRQGRTVNPIS
jgi:hypothetical protein